jgi:hypothetical protein
MNPDVDEGAEGRDGHYLQDHAAREIVEGLDSSGTRRP